MIDKHIKTLNKVRKKEISISDYLYKEGKDHEGYSCDLNCDKRYHLLIALQYDRKESDEEILEQLMKAEIEMHRNASFQGLHTSMRLNAFLLSKFNRPEYSLLFMRAKESNFDTHCGFDSEHLVGAGINETYNYLQTIKHNKIAQGIFELIGSTSADCYYTETEIKEWKNRMEDWYPKKYNPDLEDEIQMAIDLGENEILANKIEEWIKTISEWDGSNLNQLSFYSGLIKDEEGKIWANEELLKLQKTDWDKAAQLQVNSGLHLEQNNIEDSWKNIKQAHKLLLKNSDWKRLGLGRFIMENTLDLVLAINDSTHEITQAAFRFFQQEIKGMNNLHHNLLRKTIKAAEHMNDNELKIEFKKKLKIATDELNQILGK